jgi:hypothetical protein
MHNRLSVGLILVLVTCLPTVGALPPCGTEILGKSKRAMGGVAWDSIRTTHTRITIAAGGLAGEGESWQDNLTGRYRETYRLGLTSGAEGFDSTQVWSLDSSGQPRVEGAENARQSAVDKAYRVVMGYWYPEHSDAQIECPGDQAEQRGRFYVLRITPKGGRPFDLWIDAGTYLIDRTVEKGDTEIRSTYFSDYRTVRGVKVAFAVLSSNGDKQYDQRITLQTVEFNVPVRAAQFLMPAAPPPDFVIAGGKTATTVPFELLNNHLYVQVKLNGRGPFRIVCDTGAANIITPTLTKELGLRAEGALEGKGVGEKSEDFGLVKVQSLEIGDALFSNQVFMVFPIERFSATSGVEMNGLIGYEVFRRFVTKIDYEHSLITFTTPASFAYEGNGTIVPFVFNEHVPQVDGTIDGVPGQFDIDTGSGASIDLTGPFVRKHDLIRHYNATLEAVTGWGVGGAERSLLTRGNLLTLGHVEVSSPVTELSLQKKGAYASEYLAGNVGVGILKRFNLIFDYPHQQIIFERNANYDKPDVFDRSGMWLNSLGDSFEVMDVVKGGPAAAAGLTVGDKILAIDERPASQIRLPDLRSRFRNDRPGTKVRLTIGSGGETHETDLVLRDLV